MRIIQVSNKHRERKKLKRNKDENIHRFAFSTIRGKLFGKRKSERRREKRVLGYYTRVTYYAW